jgi:hypothetical protein
VIPLIAVDRPVIGKPARITIPQSTFAACVMALVLCSVVSVWWRTDPDLWGHLRFGLDILRDHRIARIDPYSFTSDIAWINHEWLSEASMALAYRAGGVPGLLLLKAGLVALSLALLGSAARGTTGAWMLSAAAFGLVTIGTALRPQLWTVLALSMLAASAQLPLRRLMILWPLLFAVWANAHGGWIVGLGIVGTWSLGRVCDRDDAREAAQLTALLVLCIIATLATPYGVDLWRFLWRTVGFGRDIAEWQSIWEAQNVWILAIWLTIAAAAIYAMHTGRWTWAAVLPVLLLGLASIKVIRLIGLFGIVTAGFLGPSLRRDRRVGLSLSRPLLVLACVAAFVPAVSILRQQSVCLPVLEIDRIAAGALQSAQPGRLMVPFNWGEYAIWHFPQIRVSMDGRRETVYSPSVLEQQRALDHGDLAILPFIRSEQPEYVWLYLPSGSALASVLRSEGYRQDVTTGNSAVLVRADLPQLMPSAAPACFP